MRRTVGMRLVVRRLAVPVAALALAAAAAACSGASTNGAIGSGSAVNGHATHGGTVTVGWENATPNFIFPYAPATNTDGYNVNLTEQMWPYLVYSGDRGKSIVNTRDSLYSSISYSNGDTRVTIDLKPWYWSDGVPITSRDFTFVYNLLKANVPNWFLYVPGLFPSDVSSVSTPGPHTVVLNLTHSYNPAFYTEDVLSQIQLLPQHAWDKTSASGKVGNYDETTAGAKAVYSFLQQQGGQMSTFATNPLWKVVDGPWALSSFQASTGYYTYVPNKHYSGPDKPYLSKIINEPFTTDTAELDDLRSGSSLDVGNLPFNDLRQESVLKSEGYSLASMPVAGVAEIMPNFYNASVGPILQQLYVRQALEELINRPQIVSKIYEGYADPGNGPVPLTASGPWASPLEKSGGPYPYSPSAAAAVLRAHGWKVVAGGTSTCQRPGTGALDCGAGISAGEALSFQLAYSSGLTGMAEQNAAIQSSEEQAGVKMTLKSEPFNTLAGTTGTCTASSHPASSCGWQLADFGYDPYNGLFPAGAGFFNTGGFNNLGGYSNPEMNQLINNTEYGSGTQAFFTYENYAAKQLPWLWLPDSDYIFVYRSNLAGFAPLNPFSGSNNPQDWYYSS
jgi:peptide/nickel transport system substrate-binding protein